MYLPGSDGRSTTIPNGFPSPFRIPPQSSGSGGAATNHLVVYNDSGGPLSKGTCVYDDGNEVAVPYPSVSALDGTNNVAYTSVLGLLAADIADGNTGPCVTFGELGGLDTSAFSTGQLLGTDASGQLTHDFTLLYAGFVVCHVLTVDATDGSVFVLPGRLNVPKHSHAEDFSGGRLELGLQVVLDGAGSVLSAGSNWDIEVPTNMLLGSVTLLADQAGDLELDAWSGDYSTFPPTITDSIFALGTLPTLSSAQSYQYAAPPEDWAGASLAKGEILRIHVNSASTITRATVSFKGTTY